MANRLSSAGQGFAENSGSFGRSGGGEAPQIQAPQPSEPVRLPYDSTQISTAGIAYNMDLAKKGIVTSENLTIGFENEWINNTAIQIKTQEFQAQKNYLLQNPNGAGLTNYMVELHKQLRDQSIGDAPSMRARSALKSHLDTAGLELETSMYNLEMQTGAQYTLDSVNKQLSELYTQVELNPNIYLSNKALVERAVSSLAPFNSYIKGGVEGVRQTALNDYDVAMAHGEMVNNPELTLAKLQSTKEYQNLDSKTRHSLLKEAERAVYHKQVEAAIQAKQEQQRLDIEDKTLESNIWLGISNGSIQYDQAIVQSGNIHDEIARNKLQAKINNHFKVLYDKESKISDITKQINEGNYLFDVSSSDMEEAANRIISGILQEKTDPSTGQPTEGSYVAIAQAFENVHYDGEIKPLETMLANTIRAGNPIEAVDASLALLHLKDRNPAIVKGLDERFRQAAFLISTRIPTAKSGNLTHIKQTIDDVRQIFTQTQSEYETNLKDYNKFIASKDVNYDLLPNNWYPFTFGSSSYSVFGNRILPQIYKAQVHADVKECYKTAYMLGLRGTEAEDYSRMLMNDIYGKTRYNSSKNATNDGVMALARYPLEKISYNIPSQFINNVLSSETQDIVLANEREYGNNSPVFLKTNLKRDNYTPQELYESDITTTPTRIINIRIPSEADPTKFKVEQRQVFYETVNPDTAEVALFYFLDKNDPTSRRYLKYPDERNPYSSIKFRRL